MSFQCMQTDSFARTLCGPTEQSYLKTNETMLQLDSSVFLSVIGEVDMVVLPCVVTEARMIFGMLQRAQKR